LSVFGQVSRDSLDSGGISAHVDAFLELFGPAVSMLFAASIIWASIQWIRGDLSRPLILILVTVLGQIAWYTLFNRIWVVTGYLMVAYGLTVVLTGAMFRTAYVRATALSAWIARGAIAALLAFVVLDFGQRAIGMANYVLSELMRDRSTVVGLDRWLKAHSVPRDANIVWDDIAYAEPNAFPNARMHGGLLRWRDLRDADFAFPDYIVISSSIYGSQFWAPKIAEQRRPRVDDYGFTMRLYQDLLHRPGAPGRAIPWIEHVATVAPETVDREKYERPPPSFTAGPMASRVFHSIRKLYSNISDFERLADLYRAGGLAIGPELRIYRVNPRESACPREEAFASEPSTSAEARWAFDGNTGTRWAAGARGQKARRAFVGIDLGCDTEAGGDSVAIRWIDIASTPAAIAIEISENGVEWRTVARHSPYLSAASPANVDTVKLDRTTRARYWRVVAEDVPEGRGFALYDVIIPD
jgi:hypothetical protein